MREDIPILSCICEEPEGTVTRHIYPMTLSRDNLLKFWEKAKNFRTLFTEDVSGDFKKFCECFISMDEDMNVRAHGLFWRVDDFVGVYYMTHITPVEAQIHYSFFDRRQRGRADMTRKMIKFVFDTYGFRRLSAEIPLYAPPPVFPFVEYVGLKREGRKRKAVLFDKEWFDVRCYGILREEAEEWETNTKKLAEDQPQVLQTAS